MKLHKAVPTGTTSQTANALQQEVAQRYMRQYDSERKRKRIRALVSGLKNVLGIAFGLGVLGTGWHAWHEGWLDKPLSELGFSAKHEDKGQNPIALPTTVEKPEVKVDASVVVKKAVEQYGPPAAERFAPFENATVDYWKNAVAADKATRGKSALTFFGVVPGPAGAPIFLRLLLGGPEGLRAFRLGAGEAAEPLTRPAFAALVAETPYLVVREGRAYYCTAGKRRVDMKDLALPAPKAAFNPAQVEFGALYDLLGTLKTQPPKMRYRVALELKRLHKTIPVKTLAFGEEITRETLLAAVRKEVDDAEACETLLAAARLSATAVSTP